MRTTTSYYLSKNHHFNLKKIGKNISIDLGNLMKLTSPFTILNKNFNEMDFIRHGMNSKEKSANERLHDSYRKIFKSDP